MKKRIKDINATKHHQAETATLEKKEMGQQIGAIYQTWHTIKSHLATYLIQMKGGRWHHHPWPPLSGSQIDGDAEWLQGSLVGLVCSSPQVGTLQTRQSLCCPSLGDSHQTQPQSRTPTASQVQLRAVHRLQF